MNKDTVNKVRTALGETEEKETGEGLGQRTIEGALLSAASLDKGVEEYFGESTAEVSYGQVKMGPLLF